MKKTLHIGLFMLWIFSICCVSCSKRGFQTSENIIDVCIEPLPARIVFSSTHDGDEDIYTINPDGSGLARLTDNDVYDSHPNWSPDGSMITFISYRDGKVEIYIMDADGRGQTRLTNNELIEEHPAWSPDGSKIMFLASTDSDVLDIYTVDTSGNELTNLTHDKATELEPKWSPGGSRILYVTDQKDNWEIYVINSDGNGKTRITDNDASDGYPDWSPDGSQIVFQSDQDNVWYPQIYVMNAGDSEQTQLTRTEDVRRSSAIWSPDGTQIAFLSHYEDGFIDDVHIMNADGSEQTQIINELNVQDVPRWSRDGSKLYFTADDRGISDIFLVDPDGSSLVNLTIDLYESSKSPHWRPCSSEGVTLQSEISPLPTMPPTPTPLPIQIPGLEDVTISTLCLNITQSYPQFDDEYQEPFEDNVTRLFNRAGIIVLPKGSLCDASLDIDMGARSSKARYEGAGSCYSGASLYGDMQFTITNGESIDIDFQAAIEPHGVIGICEREPKSDLFNTLFYEPLLQNLHQIWPVRILLIALKESSYAKIHSNALEALRELDQEYVVPELIHILRSDENLAEEASQALGSISGRELGLDPEEWEKWWESQH